MGERNDKLKVTVGILVLSLTMNGNTALSPILAKVSDAFPAADDSSVQVALSVISLVMVPAMLLEPLLERSMAKRDVALLGTALVAATAVLPQLVPQELVVIYLIGALLGVGLALVTVSGVSLVSDNFTGLERSRNMGYQALAVSLGGSAVAAGSGALSDALGWRGGYLVFAMALPILVVCALFVPRGSHVVGVAGGGAHREHARMGRGPTLQLIYLSALCLVAGVVAAVFNNNIALLLARGGLGDSSIAGLVAGVMQAMGMVAGVAMGRLVARLRRLTFAAALLLMGVGCALTGFAGSLPVVFLGAAAMGLGFAIRTPCAFNLAANMLPPEHASLGIAAVSATFNLGTFLSAYVINPVSSLLGTSGLGAFGSGGDVAVRLLVAAVGLLALAAVSCLCPPVTDGQAMGARPEEA